MKIIKPLLLLFAIYFPAAIIARMAYVDPMPPGNVVQLMRPFMLHLGRAWRANGTPLPALSVIIEDGADLAAADNFREVSQTPGRSYFGNGIYSFSTSDGSNPNTNGKLYFARLPR